MSRTIRGDCVAGASGSMAAKTMWAVIAMGRSAMARNGAKSAASAASGGIDARQAEVAVEGGAAMAGNVLHHRQDPAGEQPVRHRASDRRDLVRIVAVGAVADDRVGLVPRHVEHRRTIDVDAGGAELVGDQPVAQAHRRDAPRPVREPPAFVERRQPLAPRRPAQAGDAAALLVDQHRGVAAHRVAQVGGQPRELGRVRDVAREQDEPPRVGRRRGTAAPPARAPDRRRRR